MGTRADFYVKKENQMEWLGSIGLDGYPDGISEGILHSDVEGRYRHEVEQFISDSEGIPPSNGWPWPWNDSRTTDYAYIFENGKVMASCFGYPLFDPLLEEDEKEEDEKLENFFPDMSHIKNVDFSRKSGLIIMSSKTN